MNSFSSLSGKGLLALSLTTLFLGCSGEDSPYSQRSFDYDPSASSCVLGEPPAELGLDSFYKKYCSLYGVPVVSSENVADEALLAAWDMADQMVGQNHDYLKTIASYGVVIAIIGQNEETTDIPEYWDLDPVYWNARARGLAATDDRPAVSAGEENILCLTGDRYEGENIFVHELSHTIHQFGIVENHPLFQSELVARYQYASKHLRAVGHEDPSIVKKYFPSAYALTNEDEYWAEGVQSYYDVEDVYPETSAELRLVDPDLYDLIDRYMNPSANITLCN